MILTINNVEVTTSPAQDSRPASCTLLMMGGRLWFPAGAYPSDVRNGPAKSADVEVALRNVRIADGGSRSVFVASRLIATK